MSVQGNFAPDPFLRLVGVSWATGGGMLYLYCTLDYQGDAAPPPPIARVSGLPWGDFDLFTASNTREDPDAAKLQADVVDPVTSKMLTKYYQWTPRPSLQETKVIRGAPTTIYYVTDGHDINADNWTDDFPGFTNCGIPLKRLGAFGGTFLDCNGTAQNGIRALGINPLPLIDIGGQFPSLASAAYFADSVNAWATQVGFGISLSPGQFNIDDGKPANFRKVRADLIINTGKVRKLTPVDSHGRKPTSFTFNVRMTPGLGSNWQLQAQGFRLTKISRRSFPVDAQLKPTWSDFPAAKGGLINPGIGASVDVNVNFITLAVTMRVNGSSRNAG